MAYRLHITLSSIVVMWLSVLEYSNADTKGNFYAEVSHTILVDGSTDDKKITSKYEEVWSERFDDVEIQCIQNQHIVLALANSNRIIGARIHRGTILYDGGSSKNNLQAGYGYLGSLQRSEFVDLASEHKLVFTSQVVFSGGTENYEYPFYLKAGFSSPSSKLVNGTRSSVKRSRYLLTVFKTGAPFINDHRECHNGDHEFHRVRPEDMTQYMLRF